MPIYYDFKLIETNIKTIYVGVLTKVDLINPGGEDEVLSVVTNVRKPLALGYIMVKNRSQLDLNNNMTTAQAR
jgi:interferon-induced GTP-binding protein Mx